MNNENDSNQSDPTETNESLANDRFIHGLLGFMHQDTNASKEQRIQQVLNGIDPTEQPALEQEHHRITFVLRRILPLASAAMLLIVAMTLYIFTPQPNAYAIVDNAIQATQTSKSLRYQIRESDDESGYIGTLDMHESMSRIEIKTPHGNNFIMGTDDQGDWSIRRDQSIERSDPRGAAPRWLNTGEATLMIASLDEFLIQLKENYSIELSSENTSQIVQLNASRLKTVTQPGPDRIQVWIDQSTQLVERLELAWTPRNRRKDGAPDRSRPAPDSTQPPPHRPPQPRPHHPMPGDPMDDFWFPEFLGPNPLFDEGHNPPPPPPPLIIFQRVESGELSVDYFSPPTP